MKKRVVLLLIFLLCLSSVYALTFETSLTPVKSRINIDEEAIFTLMLRNDLTTIENFIIFTNQVEWSLSADPPSARNPKLYPETKQYINLKLKPTSYIRPGLHSVPIGIKNAETKETRTINANVELKGADGNVGTYLPGMRIDVEVGSEVDPRDEFPVKVDLINQNTLNITELTIEVRSNIIQKEYTTSLDPLETKTINFNIRIDPLTPPQEDVLYTTVTVDSHTFDPLPKVYTIKPYGEIKVTKDKERGFFKTTSVISLENTGNDQKRETARSEVGFLGNIFSRTYPQAKKVTFEGKKHFAWDVTLNAGSSTEVLVVSNYQFLVLAVLIIILGVICYYIFRSPLIIKKSAVIIGRRHGGISDLSVRMTVQNRGKYNAEDVVITDRLPNLVDLRKEFEEGTLRPSSILRHEKKGTIMKWNVSTLEVGEERIIHYKVKTRLSILGSLSLPVTVAKFKYAGEKSRVVSSNRLGIRA